jgi:hypothetical protein
MRKGYIFVKVLKCWELLENSGLVMAVDWSWQYVNFMDMTGI